MFFGPQLCNPAASIPQFSGIRITASGWPREYQLQTQ
jgi:hypothetical protein